MMLQPLSPPSLPDRREVVSDNGEVVRYKGKSPLGTDIILIKRVDTEKISGYVEAPTDKKVLYNQIGGSPRSFLEKLAGIETEKQKLVDLLSERNQEWNKFMLAMVKKGFDAEEAAKKYPDAVHCKYIRATIAIVGAMGTGAPVGPLGNIGQSVSGVAAGTFRRLRK